ncbi:MAG: uroporphyrinogen-III synthase [Candidatus Rokuibacteriota bacterium]
MPSLQGKTVALTEARRATELAALVSKLGGVPYSAPAVREIPRRDRGPALAAIDRIVRGEVDIVLFMTGVGTRALLALAAEAGRRDELLAALGRALVVARGPKPIAALREVDLRPAVVPVEPTSGGLLAALAGLDLRGRRIAVQLSGDDSRRLLDGLRAREADVLEVPLYEWALPDDLAPLEGLVRDAIAGRVDVVAFTSSPQIRHLFEVAERLALAESLALALRERVLTAVVGPVCRATLAERGITDVVEADKGTMGALAHAIAARVSGPPA